MTWKEKYTAAHKSDFEQRYPHAFKDGHYCLPKMPKVTETNGLTTAIMNYVEWTGGLPERYNVEGRTIKQKDTVTASGGILVGKSVRIKSSATKGSADIHITYNGYAIKVEVKNEATKDRMRADQKEYAVKARKAGGIYFVATNIEMFIEWWDELRDKLPKVELF